MPSSRNISQIILSFLLVSVGMMTTITFGFVPLLNYFEKYMNVMYALPNPPKTSGLPVHPQIPKTFFWREKVLKTLLGISGGIALLGILFHYLYRKKQPN